MELYHQTKVTLEKVHKECELIFEQGLNKEYRWRWGKIIDHKSCEIVQQMTPPPLSNAGLTPFVRVTNNDIDDPVESYREYYRSAKGHLANWTKRGKPDWY